MRPYVIMALGGRYGPANQLTETTPVPPLWDLRFWWWSCGCGLLGHGAGAISWWV
ncbi:hypothetical protein [Streptomyces melanogenes]|uniref:hypothetical protein n=1 Tax=Streptomyces melanogenes TaxID=67326 RepID=UPI00167C7A80|nr:hypothetical protein [Streptomyces melanogenes]